MTATKWCAALAAALVLCLTVPAARGDGPRTRTYTIFNGESRAAQDTSEYASAWIPVAGSTHINIKVWSAGASTDTATADSLTTFKMVFSDTVSQIVAGSFGVARLSAADSIMVDVAVSPGADTTGRSGGARMNTPFPINKALGSPRLSVDIYPIQPGATTVDATERAKINKSWMRIRCLPKIRMTTAGFSSTEGIRTRGINSLKMVATVYYPIVR